MPNLEFDGQSSPNTRIVEHPREELAAPKNSRTSPGLIEAGHFAGSTCALRGNRSCGRQHSHPWHFYHSLCRDRPDISFESTGDSNRAGAHGAHATVADHSLPPTGRIDLASPSPPLSIPEGTPPPAPSARNRTVLRLEAVLDP